MERRSLLSKVQRTSARARFANRNNLGSSKSWVLDCMLARFEVQRPDLHSVAMHVARPGLKAQDFVIGLGANIVVDYLDDVGP